MQWGKSVSEPLPAGCPENLIENATACAIGKNSMAKAIGKNAMAKAIGKNAMAKAMAFGDLIVFYPMLSHPIPRPAPTKLSCSSPG